MSLQVEHEEMFFFPYLSLHFSDVPYHRPQVLTAEQHRAFCRVGAIVRGFLTRRLLKTEKVKHLRQTIVVRLESALNPSCGDTNCFGDKKCQRFYPQDTQEFIGSFHSDASLKRVDYTAQDFSLQERVRAQVRRRSYPLWTAKVLPTCHCANVCIALLHSSAQPSTASTTSSLKCLSPID